MFQQNREGFKCVKKSLIRLYVLSIITAIVFISLGIFILKFLKTKEADQLNSGVRDETSEY
jgi:hypothetical protein